MKVKNENIEKSNDSGNKLILNGRYLLYEALLFSNKGGVYKGEDLTTGASVIIKEARPFVDVSLLGNDAVTVLKKEFKVLKKMANTGFAPKPIDFFQEWKHYFLVEEFIDGIPLSSYRAAEGFGLVLRKIWNKDIVENFYKDFCQIVIKLVHGFLLFHKKKIILGDVSPSNILIEETTLNIKFIDFEGAYLIEDENTKENQYYPIFTSGFASPQKLKGGLPKLEDDYYALGSLIYSILLPVNEVFKFDKSLKKKFIKEFLKDTGLPNIIEHFVLGLMEENPRKRINPTKIVPLLQKGKLKPANSTLFNSIVDSQKIKKTIDGITNYICSTVNFERNDRLWPSDFRAFTTNPLSIAYGALGISYFLHKVQSLTNDIKTWIIRSPIDIINYPPGLYVGLSGIAWAFYEIEIKDKAMEIMDMLYKHRLLFSGFDIFYGASGWGLTSLYFWFQVKILKFLDKAIEAGEFLLKTAKANDKGYYYWENADGNVYIGLAHGASGAALFLLYLHLATKEKKFLDAAIKALEFDLSYQQSKENYITFPRTINDINFLTSYWQYGSAGVGSVLIRFYKYLRENRYLKLAELCSEDAHRKYAVLPSQFRGLSGMGEFLLDMYDITENDEFLRKTEDVISGIFLFRIKKDNGIAFPGDELIRISNDYGTGSAGVGLFLHRYLTKTPRIFMIDHLVENKNA